MKSHETSFCIIVIRAEKLPTIQHVTAVKFWFGWYGSLWNKQVVRSLRREKLWFRQVKPSLCQFNSFVYTSGHCRRWRSRMEVKIMAGSLFVHCKIAYFYSVTAEEWLIVSLPNFVTIRTHFSISCKIFSWIRSTKLKIHAMEFCDFIKDSVSPSGLFVPCSLTVTSTWRLIVQSESVIK